MFSLADPSRTRDVLTSAGFGDISTSPVEASMMWGRDASDAASFLLSSGPVRFMLGQVDDSSASRAHDALIVALRP
jgi:hypothetical protein